MDCILPGSSVYGIFQSRIVEMVAISSSRGSSQLQDWTHGLCIGRWILYYWTTWDASITNPSSDCPCGNHASVLGVLVPSTIICLPGPLSHHSFLDSPFPRCPPLFAFVSGSNPDQITFIFRSFSWSCQFKWFYFLLMCKIKQNSYKISVELLLSLLI